MLFDGIVLVDGAELQNLTVQSGSAFPSSTNEGELFYRTDGASEALYVFNGEAWVRIFDQNNSISFTPVNKAGDTMTGILTLSGNPVGPMDAATKSFVENYGHTFASITSKPTTLAGYGITDAQATDADLTALANLSSTGLIVRSGNGAMVTRSIAGTSGRVVVTAGDGSTANPSIDLATFGTANTYYSITSDAYGRVASGSTTISTSEVTEGSRLYYTDARARASISGTGSLSYNPTTGVMSFTMPPQDTSSVTEGTNLYFTDARARAAISVSGSLSYNSTSGLISYTTPTTDGVTEGSTNLYYTDTRARAAISASGSLTYLNGVVSYTTPSTDGIAEGSTNKYYTDTRARAAITITAGTSGSTYSGGVLNLSTVAPLASPAFTGVPTVPTATAGTNTTQAASTAFVTAAVTGGSVSGASKWTTARDLSLTGDATATLASVDGSANVSAAVTFATVNGNVGSFGTASSVGSFTVNGKGLITAASNTPIAISTAQVTSGTFADARIAASNVTQHQAALSITESQLVDGAILARVTGNETISGTWNFSNAITGVDPTNATHLVTKQYVDNIATGLDLKASVRTATVANITLTGAQTIDGVAVVAGDRVLVKDQTTATQNGIYVAAAGAWSRALDADNTPGQEVSAGLYCFVEEGTVNADTGWVLITNGAIVLGTTSLTFAQFTGLGQITAGNGLTKTGSTISALSANAARITISAGGIDLATVTDAGGGTFKKLTTDGFGRVTGTSAVVLSDITSAMGYTPANVNSPALTGVPTAPTAGAGVNTTQIATTEFVTTAVASATAGAVATANKWTTARNLSLTGDATATLTSVDGSANVSTALTLATVNSNVGSFGSASQIPVVTVNAKGLVTAVSTAALTYAGSALTGTSLAANIVSSSLTSVGTLSGLNVTTSGATASVIVTDTGANGSNIRLAGNGATTPTKTIRAFNGSLQVIDNAYTTTIFNLTDAGSLTLTGGVSATGFTGSIGSVTPNTGVFTTLTANTGVSLNGLGDSRATNTAVTTTSATTVDTFATATYRSAKYQAQIADGTSFETLEFLVIHDGTTVYMTTYGNVFTGAASLGSFDATIATGTLTVTYTAVAATSKAVKLVRTAVSV